MSAYALIAALWLIASILAALLLGPFAGFNDREPSENAGRRLSDRDGFVAPFDPFHSPAPSPEAQHDHG